MAVIRGSRLKNEKRPAVGAPATPLTADVQPAKRLTERLAMESRTERRRREIFERLVEAARQLMFSRYLDDARVQDITDLADVGKGTFFNFFSAKELVIPEVMRERVRPLRQSVEEVKAGRASSREILNSVMNTGQYQGTPADWRNYFGSYVVSMAHDERVRRGVSDLVRETQQLVRDLVAIGQEKGEFRTDRDASDLAIYLLHALLGLQMTAWISGVGLNASELESNARLTFDLLLCPPSSSNEAEKVASPPLRLSKTHQSASTKRKRRTRRESH